MGGDDGDETKLSGYTQNDTSTFHLMAAINLVVSAQKLLSAKPSPEPESGVPCALFTLAPLQESQANCTGH